MSGSWVCLGFDFERLVWVVLGFLRGFRGLNPLHTHTHRNKPYDPPVPPKAPKRSAADCPSAGSCIASALDGGIRLLKVAY